MKKAKHEIHDVVVLEEIEHEDEAGGRTYRVVVHPDPSDETFRQEIGLCEIELLMLARWVEENRKAELARLNKQMNKKEKAK